MHPIIRKYLSPIIYRTIKGFLEALIFAILFFMLLELLNPGASLPF
jgi:hypothetical protein